MIKHTKKSIRHKALDLLARREHSYVELARKLTQREYPSDEIVDCLQKLLLDDLLSDERFTEAYVRMRSRLGFGYNHILQDLQQKGVDANVAENYLQKVDWLPLLQQAYKKKFIDMSIVDFKDRAKRLQFLRYRGYRQYEVNEIIGE